MRAEFAAVVDPIFLHVLDLLDRIGRGEEPSAQDEKSRLKGLFHQADAALGQSEEWVLAKYALASWVDEVLVVAPWASNKWWEDNTLEWDLSDSRDRQTVFYQKAKESAKLPNREALEVFYICVVLGFRGIYRDPAQTAALAPMLDLPADLETWARQQAQSIRLGVGRPRITDEPGRAGEGAPPLEGVFTAIWSSLAGVVLAAFVAIFAWLIYYVKV